MPRKRVAVLVPGILGSVLVDKAGGPIWSDDFNRNYKILLGNPARLSWNGMKASARLLNDVKFGFFSTMSLWFAIYNYVAFPNDFDDPPKIIEIGYDWRQSNLDSADDLAAQIAKFLGSPISHPPPRNEDRRLTFIMHSMGGLVVRIAIAKNLIHPDWIDRLIHIGSPLYGAQSAFGTLYGSGEILPLISLLATWRHLKNRSLFLEHLQRCIRTCPSVYELLPRKDIPYLHYSTIKRTNPINEPYLDPKYKGYAINAHALLDQASVLLTQTNILSFTIYTYSHPSLKTEIEYRVNPQPSGYQVIEVTGTTQCGDGTVPSELARGDDRFDKPKEVYVVKHAAMCRDKNVGGAVQSVL